MLSFSKYLPFGFGYPKPKHYRSMVAAAWENRDNLAYAWRILKHGVCDGCSLGPRGLRDDVIDGVHLCMTRLNLLRLNTQGAVPEEYFSDIARLRKMSNEDLRRLGRLPYPMILRKGDRGFTRVTWPQAINLIRDELRTISASRMGFFATSRGLTNETYYTFQKLARMIGTNNVELCSRLCHAASVYGLKDTVGIGAPSCSLSDFIGTDLLVLFGTDLANNQPVTAKYMHYAKKRGTKIVVINPMREPALERYWVPSIVSSAIFGTKLMDEFFQVNVGGDLAFINGVIKHLVDQNWIDEKFIDQHTANFEALRKELDRQNWEDLEAQSGLSREEMKRFAALYHHARTAVLCYSMGLTQHAHGVDNVRAIANLALSRGMIGREKCGIMAIRGHSGVQGGGECGVDADKFPGGFEINPENAKRFSRLWQRRVPAEKGLKTAQMLEAAYRNEIDMLYTIGGNLLETMPDRTFAEEALRKVRVRIHQDIVLNNYALLEGSEWVVLLPGQTRYESGGTSTSTERRIRYSPRIEGHAVGEAKPEWEIPVLIGRAVMPESAAQFAFSNDFEIRKEMARAMPIYQGIETLKKEGDSIQWGGSNLHSGGIFEKMPNQRARFAPLRLPDQKIPDGKFLLATRRGKQFNSMTYGLEDPLMGVKRRDTIFISQEDATRLRLKEGASIELRSLCGAMKGILHISDVKPRNLQAYWPEANILIERRYDPVSGEPDYNSNVEIVPF